MLRQGWASSSSQTTLNLIPLHASPSRVRSPEARGRKSTLKPAPESGRELGRPWRRSWSPIRGRSSKSHDKRSGRRELRSRSSPRGGHEPDLNRLGQFVERALIRRGQEPMMASKVSKELMSRLEKAGVDYEELQATYVQRTRYRGRRGWVAFGNVVDRHMGDLCSQFRHPAVKMVQEYFHQDDATRKLLSHRLLGQFQRPSPTRSEGPRRRPPKPRPAEALRSSLPRVENACDVEEGSRGAQKSIMAAESVAGVSDTTTSQLQHADTLDVMMTYGSLPSFLKRSIVSKSVSVTQTINDIIPTIILALSNQCSLSYDDLRDLYIGHRMRLGREGESDESFLLNLGLHLARKDFYAFVSPRVSLDIVCRAIASYFKSDLDTWTAIQSYAQLQQRIVSNLPRL